MSALTRWRPLTEMTPVQNEMNQLFYRFFAPRELEAEAFPSRGSFPVTNISETNDDIIVTAEIPGMEPKDIDISVTGDVLTVTGEKKQEKETKDESFHRIERSYGAFTRSFRLPTTVLTEKVAADYKSGVLRITLPKTPEAKRREVKIKVG